MKGIFKVMKLLPILLFIGCGSALNLSTPLEFRYRFDSTDDGENRGNLKELQGLYKDFLLYCRYSEQRELCHKNNTRMREVSILDRLDGMDENTVGVCIYGYEGRRVALLRSYWNDTNVYNRRGLFFHEMGHCLLDLEHVDQNTVDIMTPTLPPTKEFKYNWSFLVEKLFSSNR